MGEPVISEVDRLQYFLDQQRQAVLSIIEGLGEEQLRTAVLPSGWTPLGLVLHLAGAEAMWFQSVAAGTQPTVAWTDGVADPPYEPEAAFVTRHDSAAVIEHYRAQCRISNEILHSRGLDAPLAVQDAIPWPDEPITDLRWVALHLIEETARHAGHLDAARELLDGRTGLGPR